MPNPQTVPHPLAGDGSQRLFLGLSRHPGTGHAKRPGEVWMVFHGDWTAIYRLDPRDARTVHLERALDGDRRHEATRWACENLCDREPKRAGVRVAA